MASQLEFLSILLVYRIKSQEAGPVLDQLMASHLTQLNVSQFLSIFCTASTAKHEEKTSQSVSVSCFSKHIQFFFYSNTNGNFLSL